jgi:hypothetical protein
MTEKQIPTITVATKQAVPAVTMMALESLKPEEARVLIAKDVLELLTMGAIEAKHDTYVNREIPRHIPTSTQMHKVVDDWLAVHFESDKCAVCALGSLMVATVRRFNDWTVRELLAGTDAYLPDRRRITSYLERFFSKGQLDLIEIAFENTTDIYGIDEDALDTEEVERALNLRCGRPRRYDEEEEEFLESLFDYYASGLSDSELMRKIFMNIVENNGTFVP